MAEDGCIAAQLRIELEQLRALRAEERAENARLHAELDTSLARQAATAVQLEQRNAQLAEAADGDRRDPKPDRYVAD
jgi:hypothetical protein